MSECWRERTARGLKGYFERKRWPRLSLGLVLLVTGAAGFGVSQLLLHLGVTTMWQRYPLAVVVAYGVFLTLLRVWVAIERAHFDIEDPEVQRALAESAEKSPTRLRNGGNSWLDWLDVPDLDGFDSLEGCAVGVLIAAVIGLLLVALTTIAGAPVLIAEVAIDVFLVSVFYKRLKTAEREHWLGAAVRGTWIPAIAAAGLLALAGWALQILAPGAHSAGEAVRYFIG